MKCKFLDTTATLRAHEISKMMAQTRRAIDDEVNILLQGKGLEIRRETGKNKAWLVLNVGGPEDET